MPPKLFTDQLGSHVTINFPPKRIISLVPSQTELLASLALNDNVVGITKFCVHPKEWLQSKTIIGGTKNFDFETIKKLQPDLIIGNKEENYQEGIEQLRAHYPVWMSDIFNLDDAYTMMMQIGAITDREKEAQEIVNTVKHNFEAVTSFEGASVLYLIWRKPWMAAGKSTFIDSILTTTLGLRNVVLEERYPIMTEEVLSSVSPDYVFLSSEPFPFGEKHVDELKQLLPRAKFLLVDGEMFSWYGSRLIHAPAYFRSLTLG